VSSSLSACLERLTPHLRMDDVALTGGAAIDLHLVQRGRRRSRAAIADLDLIASSIDVVAPRITEVCLVSHYHVAGPDVPKFMVQLVDPEARLRVDIFPDLAGSIARARTMTIGAIAVNVLTPDDILEHKLQTLSRASAARPVDPKHARDAKLLGELLGRPVPDVAPGALVEDVYAGAAEEESCARCAASRCARFALAPKATIFALLGWDYEARRGRTA